jgi:hypothetical protein
MLLAFFLAAQLPFPLSDAVDQWRREIEAKSQQTILFIRVPGDPVPAVDMPVLRQYFAQPDFARSFELSQAMTFRYSKGELERSLVLLNLVRMADSGNSPEVLIAHELGHLWLHSLGLRAPRYIPVPLACASIHIGDIVQHILLRREQDRRGIAWRQSYQNDYERAAATLRQETTFAPGDDCLRIQRLSLMIDVRDSFAAREFAVRDEYLTLLARQDPEAEAIAIELLESLEPHLTLELADYQQALELTRQAVGRLLGVDIMLQLH